MGAGSSGAAEWALLALGGGLVVVGIRGLPGARRLLSRPGVRHTWRHGALVFAAITYAITVPAIGAMTVLWAFFRIAD